MDPAVAVAVATAVHALLTAAGMPRRDDGTRPVAVAAIAAFVLASGVAGCGMYQRYVAPNGHHVVVTARAAAVAATVAVDGVERGGWKKPTGVPSSTTNEEIPRKHTEPI